MTIWPGSRLSLQGGAPDGPLPAQAPDVFVLLFLLAAGVALILNYGRLLAAIRASFSCYRGLSGTLEVLGNNYLCNSLRVVFLLLLPLFAMVISRIGISRAGYWWTLAAIVMLVLLRKFLYLLLGWLSSHETALRSAERTGWALFVPAMLFSLIVLLLSTRFPNAPNQLWYSILAVIGAACVVFCLLRERALILHSGFSVSFWVLYICALELLPICVVVKFLMNGN